MWERFRHIIYLQLQNNRPFLNEKSSFCRGNSPSSLHFQSKVPKKVGIYIAIRTVRAATVAPCWETHTNKPSEDPKSNCGPGYCLRISMEVPGVLSTETAWFRKKFAVITANCKIIAIFSVEIHSFQRNFLHHFWIFNRKFRNKMAFILQLKAVTVSASISTPVLPWSFVLKSSFLTQNPSFLIQNPSISIQIAASVVAVQSITTYSREHTVIK